MGNMSLFKKKNKNLPLYDLLNERYERACIHGDTHFYCVLLDKEVSIAREWARRNMIYMDVDHKSYGNVFYKFSFKT